MPRFDQRDDKGEVTGVIVIDEQKLKDEPDSIITSRGPLKSKAAPAPEGYEHIASMQGDPDALVTDCMLHIYAKKGSYTKEKPSKLSGLKAVVETAKEEAPK